MATTKDTRLLCAQNSLEGLSVGDAFGERFFLHPDVAERQDYKQYGSVKPRDAINRRLYKGLIIVKTAIYRVFAISGVSSKNLIRTVLSGLGDRDTTCAIAGGIVAISTGVEGIPTTWLQAREPLPKGQKN